MDGEKFRQMGLSPPPLNQSFWLRRCCMQHDTGWCSVLNRGVCHVIHDWRRQQVAKKYQTKLSQWQPVVITSPPKWFGKSLVATLTAENNYATKSSLFTIGCPTLTPKTASSPSMISTPSITPIPRLTLLTTTNGIQIQSAVFPQFAHRQTDRQMG